MNNNKTTTRYEVRKTYKYLDGESTIAKFENPEEAMTYAELWIKGSGEQNPVRIYRITEELVYESGENEPEV